MQVLAFDTETALIRPAKLAPPLVCLTWAEPRSGASIAHRVDAHSVVSGWLARGKRLVGHNVAYDLAVLCEAHPSLVPLVFQAYAEDRVTDTKIRQQLLDIAGGRYRGEDVKNGPRIKHGYSLEQVASRMAGLVLQKDGWRYSYGEFIDIPLDRWVERAKQLQDAAREELLTSTTLTEERFKHLTSIAQSEPEQCLIYPLADAEATLAIYLAQEEHAQELHDQYRQARAAWWLHLSSAWGLRTSPEGVATLREETKKAYGEVEQDLIALGLVREDGTRDTKAAKARMIRVCAEAGLSVRRTESHGESDPEKSKCRDADGNKLPPGDERCIEHVCLDSDACNETGDDPLELYAEFSTLKKVLSNDVEMLSSGVLYPVHTRYDIAETGRTTSSKPNIQNLRRLPGIREAFVPRARNVFAGADYPQLELYTLAQCCMSWIGESKLADALNEGLDPHLAMAATILGISYELAAERLAAGDEDVDAARQTAKVANFGFPGGLGVMKLCLFAKKTYRVELTEEQGRQLKSQWFATWPEMPHYFARINGLMDPVAKRAKVESLFTRRIRGGATYCAACNSGFQGLGSDCAKEAGWRIAQAQYVDTKSPLYNTRTVAFIHDEFIVECADDPRAHDAAYDLARLMREGANTYLPDVPIPASKMKPLLMRRWSKKAKPTFDLQGRLVAWQ